MAINPKIKQKAEDIRSKIFGSEVRESLASGLEGMSEDVESIKGRQGYVEEQFQDVLDETTGKDVISAPELIAARNGKSNLKTRLDDEHAEVTAQLQQKAEQDALNIEKARIDAFTSLQEGSTTGDAELIDGRVGADTVTYPNIGGAIRAQFSNTELALGAISYDVSQYAASASIKRTVTTAFKRLTNSGVFGIEITDATVGDTIYVTSPDNLITNIINSQTIVGVLVTKNTDNSITVNGTPTGTWSFPIFDSVLPKGTYVVSGCPSGGGDSAYRIRVAKNGAFLGNEVGSGYTITLTEPAQITLALYITKDYVFNNVTFYPKLEVGTVKTAYSAISVSSTLIGSLPNTVLKSPLGASYIFSKGGYAFTANHAVLSDVAKPMVTPQMFGDCVNDFANALTLALDNEQGYDVYVPGGTYLLNAPVRPVKGLHLHLSNDTVIKANAAMEYMFQDNIHASGASGYHYGGFVKGGTIDCNYLARAAVVLNYTIGFRMQDTTIINIIYSGIVTYYVDGVNYRDPSYYSDSGNTLPASGGTSTFDNIHIINANPTHPNIRYDCVGFYNNGNDNTFINCVTENIRKGVFTRGGNRFYNVHPWLGNPNMFDGSMAFEVSGTMNFFTACVADTMQTGLYLRDYYVCTLTACRFSHANGVIDPSTVTVKPCIIMGSNTHMLMHNTVFDMNYQGWQMFDINTYNSCKDGNRYKLTKSNTMRFASYTVVNEVDDWEVMLDKRLSALEV